MPSTLRQVARMFLRRPGISFLLVLTMALAIGSTTSVFSVLDAVILKPSPYPNGEELAELWNRDPVGTMYSNLDPERAARWLGERGLFTRVESYADRSMLLGGVSEPAELRAVAVTAGLFPLLGVAPAQGRGFLPEDTLPGAPPVAIVSAEFRRAHLEGMTPQTPSLIRLDDRLYTVIGVMPDWFRYPRGIVSVWLPLRPEGPDRARVNYVTRFPAGMTHADATAAMKAITARMDKESPRLDGWGAAPMFLDARMVTRDVKSSLWLLAGAVGCVLLVACANAANLLLVQATTRHRELGIRSALGATRGRLISQLLIESLTLATLGAAAGVGLAYLIVGALPDLMPRELSVFANARLMIDHRVLLFGLAATILTWVLCGVGPALHAARRNPARISGGRTETGSRATKQIRNGLVVAQLGLSLVLLAVTGLFLRSLQRLNAVDPGFDISRVLTVDLSIPQIRFATGEQRAALERQLRERLTSLPGIRRVSVTTGLPPQSGITFGSVLEAEGSAAPVTSGEVVIPFAEVDTGFFAAMGIPLEKGRAFMMEDVRGDERNVIVNLALVQALWPGQDPIGRRFRIDPDRPWLTVVGVVGSVKLLGPDDRQFPYSMYYPRPEAGRATQQISLAIRTAGPPAASAAAVRRAIHEVYPDLPLWNLLPASERFAEGVAKPRFVLLLLGVFAGLGLVLALVGVYGVTSYAVLQRTREIGIRMALGAGQRDVLRTFLGEGAVLTAIGLTLGVLGTLATSHLAAALLFGVGPRDPVVISLSVVVLASATLLGIFVPARRASRVSPMVAMEPD